ncbi:hypothetical protein ACL1HS_09300 [Corynebacterium striatum]|uniref:Secreted protein n=2 Tax=Corynebacterium striatum TaxID=43770 RepID=A0ABX7DCB4_CORST|nr:MULTISPECIES: hypothetical protein [Corynebacterium]NHX52649.1 hypothetical protein [Corynebacterium striatum]NHY37252.1 hypothetical protein [Corynebacterium striatum]OFT60327.1 hypothetical protein HMPREF3148_12420 [Corynebacterium sp. HMSC05D08]QQU76322.1 hypothetical protein I6I72_09320 [Corynebacterium striatum]HAT1133489.1 hypothetical protein [Corynebacterium striatum]
MDNSQENKSIYIAIAVAVLALIALVGGSVLAMRMLGGAKENAQSQLAPLAEAPATGSTSQEDENSESSQRTESEKSEETATMTKTVEQTVTQEYTAPATKDSSSDLPAGFNPSAVACDGRGVLIVDSVVANSPAEALPQIQRSVANNPGAEYYNPGICPSLRGEVAEGKVYPVVIDYGFDTDALCYAASRLGGNPRILSTRAEFLSPC